MSEKMILKTGPAIGQSSVLGEGQGPGGEGGFGVAEGRGQAWGRHQ